ncbi:MAG TPA: hypothetical protein PK611_04775 [Saprospiraceae bacterium]|nr:hypothetical protein [Saprospiraceae bacterium]
MKQSNKIQPFDNLLLAYITSQDQENLTSSSSDKEASIVFSKQYEFSLPKQKVETMLSDLSKSLSKDSLGVLVQRGLAASTTSVADIQSVTGLTPSLLDDIKADMVFTNSVPVRSLVKLLKFLNISLDKAQAAIQTTFEKLSAESRMFLSIPAKAQPAFRKGMTHGDASFDFKRLRSDESYLYQNKEALDKYTNRLSEIYQES